MQAEPEVIAERLARVWDLELGARLPLATCSHVYSARRAGVDVVLKVPHEGSEERHAAWAVRAFEATGGVDVIEVDDATGALLMPRLGSDLASSALSEEARVRAAAALISRLHTAPIPAQAEPICNWFKPPDVASALLQDAIKVVGQLLDTSPEPVLLHGDLHHFNILQGPKGWTAIDPKGVQGDPAFEPCAYMRNPLGSMPDRNLLPDFMLRRLRVLAEELPYPVERMWAWAFVQTTWCGIGSCSSAATQWAEVAEALWGIRADFGFYSL